MSQQIGGYPPSPATGSPSGQPTTQVARDEAADVGRTAADAGRQVAGTAAEQAGNVAQEVKTQARDLVGEARSQVKSQARTGQQKAAEGVLALSMELREMADGGQQSGPVSEIARQAAERAEGLATWIGEREPADLLDEVRLFARRRPGVFLLGMAVAGVVVGRLTRGAVDSARSDSGPTPQRAYGGPAYREPAYPAATYGQPGYADTPAAPPVPYDTPTPPRGTAVPRPYATPATGSPAASPLPPAPAVPAYDPDPLAPVEPGGRHSPGTAGDYVDDLDRDTRRGSDERLDDPFRPGGEYR